MERAGDIPHRGRRVFSIALSLLALAALAGAAIAWRSAAWPKRFGVVEEGRLYRSGELSPRQLESVAREKRVRTVLSLLNPDTPGSVQERRAAERLGIRWINVPLPGDGASTPETREAIRSVILDDACGPTLVHCAAGTNRTGLACGMYRIRKQGWTVEQVLDEMRRYDFEDLDKHANVREALQDEARLAASTTKPAADKR